MPPTRSSRTTHPRLLPRLFIAWLIVLYVGWLVLMLVGNLWNEALEHWPIAIAMTIGSYIAGSTPMGGGTIGFPILVLVFGEPAAVGRDFSFAIQAVGMTSASVYILLRRIPIAWAMLLPAMLGALIATPIAIVYLAPHINDIAVKLVFATIWAAFGIAQLTFMRELLSSTATLDSHKPLDLFAGFLAGVIGGGFIASITGVGIDMLLYVVLVLLVRVDTRMAIPTSVLLMAFTSIVGLITTVLTTSMASEVWSNWYAAAPIVAIGAPLGAMATSILPRGFTLAFVSIVCVAQFVAFCFAEHISGRHLIVTLGSLAIVTVMFALLQHWGTRRMAARRSTPNTR